MSTIVHELVWPDRVVVGTVGLPGARTFYLQVRSGSQIVSIALEKEQSALLAQKIDEILDDLMTQDGNRLGIPESTPVELVDDDPLEQPVDEQFRTGTMSLGWDPSTAQIVIEAFPFVDDDEAPDAEPAEMLLLRLPVGTARAFAKRTREVVGAGRALCPLCGMPLEADGHVCRLLGDL
jgi:uncharacterized repeat protein (TIGR03847 family)